MKRSSPSTRPGPDSKRALALVVRYAIPRRGLPSSRSFAAWVRAALEATRRRASSELSIRIVGTREGRALNREYRSRDYATNVLSFPVELPRGVVLPLIGDLVICAPVVAREAREQGKPLAHHYAHLTIHGVLHLLGHEHAHARAATKMEAIERHALARFGISDPYRAR